MKTATIRQVRHDFGTVLAWIAEGEEVTVLNRTRPVARILPPRPVVPRPGGYRWMISAARCAAS